MSKKNKIKKNFRLNVSNFESVKIVLKSVLLNKFFPYMSRWNCVLNLSFFKNNATSSLVDRCILTGHRKKFHFLFKFSRLVFLRLARDGQIFGLKKFVW